jgi:hypothetical protein
MSIHGILDVINQLWSVGKLVKANLSNQNDHDDKENDIQDWNATKKENRIVFIVQNGKSEIFQDSLSTWLINCESDWIAWVVKLSSVTSMKEVIERFAAQISKVSSVHRCIREFVNPWILKTEFCWKFRGSDDKSATILITFSRKSRWIVEDW